MLINYDGDDDADDINNGNFYFIIINNWMIKLH